MYEDLSLRVDRCMRVDSCGGGLQERAVAPGGPPLTAMAFWDGQAGAFKDAGRAGGGRHACPRRGRAACGVGRSGRIEGEVGRRGVLWQEKSWARREVRSPPRFFFLTLPRVRVFAGGLSAGYGLVGGVDGG